MIDIAHLQNSIYAPCLFEEKPAQVKIINSKEGLKDKVEHIVLTSSGKFVNISNNILRKSREIYNTFDRSVSFQKDCDGICLLHRGNRNFLIFTEVKSSFSNMEEKAYFQLITSYVRCKAFLSTLEDYIPSEFEEVALAISYPYVDHNPISNNNQYQESRQSTYGKYALLKKRYRHQLKANSQLDMNIADFEINKLHLREGLINESLHLIHIPIENGSESATIDIDNILL